MDQQDIEDILVGAGTIAKPAKLPWKSMTFSPLSHSLLLRITHVPGLIPLTPHSRGKTVACIRAYNCIIIKEFVRNLGPVQ